MSGKLNCVLVAMLMACAMSLVNSQYQARRLFIELEKAQSQSKQYELQWSQLRLDQSTLANPARIEQNATEALAMVPVTPARTQYLTAGSLKGSGQ
jgi:cell division protein FtsL